MLRDLTDVGSVRNLQLPPAEQAKQQALQELEDERLTKCRSTSAFEFDQCFFFGSMATADARRPLEGMGKLSLTPSVRGQPAPPASGRNNIPTW